MRTELDQVTVPRRPDGAPDGAGGLARSVDPALEAKAGRTEYVINTFLETATNRMASDLIITAEAPPTMRVDEELHPIIPTRLRPSDCEALLYQMLTADMAAKYERYGEVDFAYSVSGLGRYRVNGFRQRGSTGIVIRIIPPRIRTIGELGLPDVVTSLVRRPNGLILVTGPTGSGKSTTLAAMIDLINEERPYHIVTLEDPIEYLHRHKRSIVNQREIGKDTRTYATGLRAALRENPDVILVGELRDLETISVAITAAETGHLVMSTLHTCDAALTIDRIIDVFPPHQQGQIRVQLAGTLQGVIAQQLVMRADGRGRVGAFEILVATPAVRNLIREGKTHQIPIQLETGARYGMQTMEGALRGLMKDGVITEHEYRRKMSHLVASGAHVPTSAAGFFGEANYGALGTGSGPAYADTAAGGSGGAGDGPLTGSRSRVGGNPYGHPNQGPPPGGSRSRR